jgi:hypothetical protein
MKTSRESAEAMGRSIPVRFLIGLAALLGGLLLAWLGLVITGQAGKGVAILAAGSVSDGGPVAVLESVDPLCGTLDGVTIDPMEDAGNWYVGSGAHAVSASLEPVPGYEGGRAVRIRYHLSTTAGLAENWVQLRRNFAQPITLPAGAHLRFRHRGTTTNSLQIGLVSADEQFYFSGDMGSATHTPWWTYATWDTRGLRNGAESFSHTQPITAIFISVKNSQSGDVGGPGSFTVDELEYLDIARRDVPPEFEWVTVSPALTRRAANWIAQQQCPGGLLKSWQEEEPENAWLYDQALGLIVLCESGHIPEAQRLAHKLRSLQNDDGSWYAGYNCMTDDPTDGTEPVGASAWTVYALSYYSRRCEDPAVGQDAKEGADWLARLQREDGSLPALPDDPANAPAPTEPNLGAWRAFRSTGYHQIQANLLRSYLLTQVWDSDMGRFRASPTSYEIFLDNQTWGASFLQAIHRDDDARRALSYARWTLATTSSDGSICGFDGAGPFSVWNEGTLQYVAAHGENSQFYWEEMTRQQASDGGLPGSPDSFSGYIVWLAQWHGVAPTAWLYFAGTGGPFYPPPTYLPLALNEKTE